MFQLLNKVPIDIIKTHNCYYIYSFFKGEKYDMNKPTVTKEQYLDMSLGYLIKEPKSLLTFCHSSNNHCDTKHRGAVKYKNIMLVLIQQTQALSINLLILEVNSISESCCFVLEVFTSSSKTYLFQNSGIKRDKIGFSSISWIRTGTNFERREL